MRRAAWPDPITRLMSTDHGSHPAHGEFLWAEPVPDVAGYAALEDEDGE